MGRSLLIILFGFATSFGILAYSKDSRMLQSVDQVMKRVENYSVKNSATSGAFMVLNHLYQDVTWRTGYVGVSLAGDSLEVVVDDAGSDPSLLANRIRVLSTSRNAITMDTSQVVAMVFDGEFQDFAVWAKDSVRNVVTLDSTNNPDTSLIVSRPATAYMPEIDKTALISAANYVEAGGVFNPGNGYPNGDFYDSGTTPNIIHVVGDLHVHSGRTIYGIYVIEGNVVIEDDALVQGVLFLPNTGSMVLDMGGAGNRIIQGGVITWGGMDAGTNWIVVRHWPEYMNKFAAGFAANNPPMRVIAWESSGKNN